jgi:hypothetical protein
MLSRSWSVFLLESLLLIMLSCPVAFGVEGTRPIPRFEWKANRSCLTSAGAPTSASFTTACNIRRQHGCLTCR